MHYLIVLQAADGSWRLTKELAALLGHDLHKLRIAIEDARGSLDDVLHAWATALALAWLEQHAANAKTSGGCWQPRGESGSPPHRRFRRVAAVWIEAARKFLR